MVKNGRFFGTLCQKSLWWVHINMVKPILFWKYISNAFQRCIIQVKRLNQSQLMIFFTLEIGVKRGWWAVSWSLSYGWVGLQISRILCIHPNIKYPRDKNPNRHVYYKLVWVWSKIIKCLIFFIKVWLYSCLCTRWNLWDDNCCINITH